jgi:excisionase family DNA binding protein
MPELDVLTAKQAMTLLNVSENTLYKYCREGRIPHFRVGNAVRFRRSVLAEWIADQEAKSTWRRTA